MTATLCSAYEVETAPVGPTVRGMVRELRALAMLGRQDLDAPQVDLELLDDGLDALTPKQLKRFDLAAKAAAAPLGALLGCLRTQTSLAPTELRTLCSFVQSLDCMREHTVAAGVEGWLSAEHLALRYSSLDLSARLRSLFDVFQPLAVARHLDYQLATPRALKVEVDVAKLDLVWLILLFRAFKHTPEGGKVHCQIGESDLHPEAFIRVENSGGAVAAHEAKHFFERFRQSEHSAVFEVEGITVSLGIARDLLTLQGGTLSMESHDASGTAFCASFPTRAAACTFVADRPVETPHHALKVAQLAASELQIESALEMLPLVRDARPVVLLIGDSRRLHRILRDGLEPEYAVVSALAHNDAVAKATALRPDLIVIRSPFSGKRGESTIATLRKCSEIHDTAVLVLAGGEGPSDVARLLEEGVDDVVQVPFFMPELRARARHLVGVKRTRELLTQTVHQRDTDLFNLGRTASQFQCDLQALVHKWHTAQRGAEKESRIKSNFLRMMSHELKTPIATMQLQLGVLRRELNGAAPSKVVDGFERISRSSRRMLNLANTMLEWARVEDGRCELNIEEFDLNLVLSEVVAEFMPQANQKRIALEMHRATSSVALATGDRRLVHLVVLNMLNRAIQVTGQGAIELAAGQKGKVHWVSVRDGGSPIPPEQYVEIFDPLLSVDDLYRRSGSGSGLQLHVVRDIARAFDGDLVFEPTEGRGNTFLLKLPPLPPERTTARIYTGLMTRSGDDQIEGRL